MPKQDLTTGQRADLEVIEKQRAFLDHLEDDRAEISRKVEVLMERHQSQAYSEADLSSYAMRIEVALKSFVNRVRGLAATRMMTDDFRNALVEAEGPFRRKRSRETKFGEASWGWNDFADRVFEVLRICQIFMEEHNLVLTGQPLAPDTLGEIWNEIRIEFQGKRMKRKAAITPTEEIVSE